MRYGRARAWRSALLAGVVLGASPRPAAANPDEGEPRPIVRDADRVYTVVAGEADGASTVTNPGNLGYLRGVSGIVDLALMSPQRRRRGSGVGAFVGLPLPLRLAAVGLGYQLVLPWQPESAASDSGSNTIDPQGPDDFFHKISMAVAIPVGAWVRLFRPRARRTSDALDRLSLGLGYSRLISSGNFHAHGTNQVDVALSYWPIRFLALGLVGRSINLPRTGRSPDATDAGVVLQPAVVDPEVAIRPLGTPALEVAVGARISPVLPEDFRFLTNFADPRLRLIASTGGVRVFVEAETLRFNPITDLGEAAVPRTGARINAGVELSFARFGVAVAPLMSAGARSAYGVDGVAARLRISQERHPTLASPRRVVTKLTLARYQGDRGMWTLVEHLDAAAQRRGLVLIETRGMSLGYAQTEELREAILRVRNRGGKVIVYLNGGSLRSYFLASAADRILAHPNASLSILGMRVQTLYYHDLLQRLGAEPQFVRVAEYKAWPETVHRTTASEPVAAQRHMLHADLWNHVIRLIARERGQDLRVVKEWIDDAPLRPADAQKRGLVDDLAFPDEIDSRLEDWLGRKIRIEAPRQSRQHAVDYGPPPRIAVLLVQGDIVQGDSFTVPLLGRTVAGDSTLTQQIAAMREDPSVRAVVVRIDSPGGDVGSADAITRELDLLRKEKPVIISMGNTCASGGYYIATAGQYIYADATTRTGSIGIFYPKVDISGTLAKLGISVDEEDFGRRAGMRSWLRPYDDDEWQAAQADIEASYAQFVGRVARARSMTPEQADRVARGRVWSGVRAIDEGLVDDYGGLREAIGRARTIVGLRPGEGVIELVPRPLGRLENLRAVFGFSVPNPLAGRAAGFAAAVPAQVALRSLLPAGMLTALRHLPLPLWWGDGPRPMALAEQGLVIED
ncbi:MAG: signal peptide peptidase SppA [Myxococcota bacterium]